MTTTRYTPETGEIVWYKTGNYTASRVRVLAVNGHGAAQTAIVDVIDRLPEQPSATASNKHLYPTGGIPVSTRSLRPLTAMEQREWDLIEAAYEFGPLDGTDEEEEEEDDE